MYTISEAVNIIVHVRDRRRGKSGANYVCRMKAKMISDQLVPVKKAQLNKLVVRYGGMMRKMHQYVGTWRGQSEIDSLSKMKSRFQEHHKQTASLWLPKHTRAALFDFKKENAIKDGIDPSM